MEYFGSVGSKMFAGNVVLVLVKDREILQKVWQGDEEFCRVQSRQGNKHFGFLEEWQRGVLGQEWLELLWRWFESRKGCGQDFGQKCNIVQKRMTTVDCQEVGNM